MPSHHTEKLKKPLGVQLLMYTILLGVIILGIYLLQSSLFKQASQHTDCQYDKAVCSYLTKLQNPATYYTGSFTVTITTATANQKQHRIIVRSDTTNNLDIITYNENILTGQSVVVDNIIYKKDLKSNSWMKTNQTVDPMLKDIKTRSIREVTKMGTDVSYTFLGDSTCGKKMCMKYELITKEDPSIKTYVLFTQTNYMLKEIIKQSLDGTTIDVLFVYSDVTVTPPPTR